MTGKQIILAPLLACCLLIHAPLGANAAGASSHCGPEPNMARVMNQAMYEAVQLLDKDKLKPARQRLDKFAKRFPAQKHFRFSYLRGILITGSRILMALKGILRKR